MPVHVIDVNMLGNEDLAHWLAASPTHVAVLTDAALREIACPVEPAAWLPSFGLLRHFPTQVYVMVSVEGLQARDQARSIQDLLNGGMTNTLQAYLMGDPVASRDMLSILGSLGRRERALRANLLPRLVNHLPTLANIAEQLKPWMIGFDGRLPVFTANGYDAIKSLVLQTARAWHDTGVAEGSRRRSPDLQQTFEMRHAACAMALMALRFFRGSMASISGKKAYADTVDCVHIASATYVHGFQTCDALAADAYRFVKRHIVSPLV